MASERLRSAQDLLDLTFQSLAMQHMDLKQVELDTAVAKVDELSRQLESLWTDGPGPPKEPFGTDRSRSPLGRRSTETPEGLGELGGRPGSPWAPQYLSVEDRAPHYPPMEDRAPQYLSVEDRAPHYLPMEDRAPHYLSMEDRAPHYLPMEDRAPSSPRPPHYPPPEDRAPHYLPMEDRAPSSPRPPHYPPPEDRAPSPRPKVLSVPYEGLGGRAPSPRPLRPYESLGFGGSPPFLPAPPPYEAHGLCPPLGGPPGPFRAQGESGGSLGFWGAGWGPHGGCAGVTGLGGLLGPPKPLGVSLSSCDPILGFGAPPPQCDPIWGPPVPRDPVLGPPDDLVLKRRPPRGWNESDLDAAGERRPPSAGGGERPTEAPPSLRPSLGLAPWRESSLDGTGGGKEGPYGGHSATLPRNYKVSPLRRSGAPLPPRGWAPPPQPASRVPVPPPGRPPRHKPLPLSMIFKLQNALWEQGVGGGSRGGLPPPPRAPQKQPQAPPGPLGGEGPSRPTAPDPSRSVPPDPSRPTAPDPSRPAPPDPSRSAPPDPSRSAPPDPSPPPPDADAEPEALVADPEGVERPLSPTRLQPVLPPEARRVPALQELARALAEMPRPLKRRGSMELSPGPAPPPARARRYRQLIPRLLHRAEPAPDPAEPEPRPAPAAATPTAPAAATPTAELRPALRAPSSPRRRPGARVRLDPLVLLLDAALSGELDVVRQAVAELNDPSQPNAEGITALHNAICGANYGVVEFLIGCGADVNSPDSHGWTPLHCAASCNDTSVCVALVQHGAAVFATTSSDGSLAADKCDPFRQGYADCYSYLTGVEQGMGVLNRGVVYALWDRPAALPDELSFREGDSVTVLRRPPPPELDWWWGSLSGHQGYVPRNYFGLFPRVRPQRKKV
ncbi:relA-associated inhibitor [Patagioenas fasciata]|uniref:relA-associated inhibitor n=1 Tax=Patagioenas fasciata TaxID=372321 RepID=UPI003A9A5947